MGLSVIRTRFLIPHLLLPLLPFLPYILPRRSMLFLAGDLAQLHLPVGMKKVNLSSTKVAGKATSE